MMRFLSWTLACCFLFPLQAIAQAEVAVVKMLRGEAFMRLGQENVKLLADQKVVSGATVVTGDKSFVRLIFTDKSQMNIGPNSEMKIEQFGGADAGVIGLVKGKIRSEVSKDYLQQRDKEKSKLFIKTPNAVMGVRGTKFQIATNGTSTNTVLFEGHVVFNYLANASTTTIPTDILESTVNGPGTVSMQPGEFSVQMADSTQPTVPAILNVQQLETMEQNPDFSSERGPTNQDETSVKSIVPSGLSGEAVANSPEALKGELSQIVASLDRPAPSLGDASAAGGFEQNGQLKPTNGSFLHVDSGVVVAPPKDSVYDSNSNSYLPSSGAGKISADGNYLPPKNITITGSGKILLQAGSQVIEIKATSPVMGQSSTLGDVMKLVSSANMTAQNTSTAVDTTKLVAAVESKQSANSNTQGPNLAAPIILPPSIPKEAPTLCSTCGGAIPGSPATVSSNSTTQVTINPQ